MFVALVSIVAMKINQIFLLILQQVKPNPKSVM